MDVIPVIDVRHGVAVAAARGDRQAYRPLDTPLCRGSDPVAVARGYAGLFAFQRLYVADLDGIEGRGANAALAAQLASALPGTEIWIDDGSSARDAAGGLTGLPILPVLGSESMRGADDIAALRALPRDRYVLSLDFKDDRFVGPPAVLDEPQHWPGDVIVMTLARVGSAAGPDLRRISDIVARAGAGRRIYAAGGVRERSDIEALHRAGAAGVLVATALHRGTIKAGDLEEIAGL